MLLNSHLPMLSIRPLIVRQSFQRGVSRVAQCAAFWSYFALSCAPSGGVPQPSVRPGGEVLLPIVIEREEVRQEIRGFGASSAWTAPALSDELADAFFSVERGIGLNLLRIQIKPDGTSSELETVDAAVARDAEVWAAPWSPPASMKTNNSTSNGGELKEENYSDWAESLADFAQLMNDRGTPLLAISAQNEPDYTAEWDTCRFTPEQLAVFVGDHLVPALAQLEHPVPVLAPESANWGSLERFSEALVDHEPALESILAFATHGYGRIAPREQPAITEVNGEIWQTEVSDPEQDTPDDGMASAQRVARMIHADLTVGQVSAWHYWWLLPRGDVDDTNAGLANKNFELTRRAYALGHFSKFVRPGYVRLEATTSPAYLTFSSAFESPRGDEIIVVISSDRSLELVQEIHVPGSEILSAEMWVTDAERELVPLESVSGSAEAVTVVIPPKSIVTVILSLT